jgi:hypothetical protein
MFRVFAKLPAGRLNDETMQQGQNVGTDEAPEPEKKEVNPLKGASTDSVVLRRGSSLFRK